MFYAWQHGHGCMTKLPKEEELLQMPGRGDLDFKPLVDSLSSIGYSGYTEIFMHPVPRGIPILPTAARNNRRDQSRARLLGVATWVGKIKGHPALLGASQ